MSKTKSGNLLALLTIVSQVAGLAAPQALYAQSEDRELKLPYDFKVDEDADYIELDDDKKGGKNKPSGGGGNAATRDQAPVDPRGGDRADDGGDNGRDNSRGDDRNGGTLVANPNRVGNECNGLRNGDYAHAQNLYTRIFEQNGRILVTYPVFMRGEEVRREAGGDRRQQYGQSQQQGMNRFQPQFPQGNQGQSGYQQQGQGQQFRFQQFPSPMGQQSQLPQQRQMEQVAGEGYVLEDRQVTYPARAMPVYDQYGRQVFVLDMYGRPIRPAVQYLPPQTVIEKVRVPVAGRVQVPQQPLPRPLPQRPGRSDQDGGWQVEEGCVALPFLRIEEVLGARSTAEAQSIITRNGRVIKRTALNATQERTPQNLGPISASDPGFKSR